MKSKQKALTLSIIIPVFNEEDYLAECLDSIAKQTDMPNEVVVVDNNSTDKSVAIAKRYGFVKVIHEKQQHQSHAQKAGFDIAKSELFGRIDADTVLASDWTTKVKKQFKEDSDLSALTGSGLPYDMFAEEMNKAGFERLYSISQFVAGHDILWGANCVIAREAWQDVRDEARLGTEVWEDYDLSFVLNSKKRKILRDNTLVVGASFRATSRRLIEQIRYQKRAVNTFNNRLSGFRGVMFTVVWASIVAVYPLMLLEHKVLQPLFGTAKKPGLIPIKRLVFGFSNFTR